MSSAFHQTVIIGGGLAGLISTIHLAKLGVDVLLIEKKDFPRHKVCGEYVSNEVRPYLESLDAFPSEYKPLEINRFQLTSLSGKSLETPIRLGGFGISRFAFDEFLYQKAKSLGAEIWTNRTISSVEFQGNFFNVKLQSGESLRAKTVIGAFGKRSLLDKDLGRDFIEKRSDYVGIKQHFRGDFPDDLVSLHLFQGGYCGLSKVENDVVNLCYLTENQFFKKYGSVENINEKVLSKNHFLQNFLKNAEPFFEPALVISQISFDRKDAVENHILMAGDSAGLIHPLCGNGMAMAIHAGKMASEETRRFLKNGISRAAMEKNYQTRWNKIFQRRLVFGRWMQKLFENPKMLETGISLGARLPFLMKKVVEMSHGKTVKI